MTNSMHKKNQDINRFFPEKLMIKESCNMIGGEAHLTKNLKIIEGGP